MVEKERETSSMDLVTTSVILDLFLIVLTKYEFHHSCLLVAGRIKKNVIFDDDNNNRILIAMGSQCTPNLNSVTPIMKEKK